MVKIFFAFFPVLYPVSSSEIHTLQNYFFSKLELPHDNNHSIFIQQQQQHRPWTNQPQTNETVVTVPFHLDEDAMHSS